MKIKITRTGAVILALVFMAVLTAGGLLGFLYWREHLAIGLSAEEQYVIGTADLTDPIQYATMTNAFTLSFIFTVYGIMCGFIVNTAILGIYTVVKLIVNNTEYFEAKRAVKEQIRERTKELTEERRKKAENKTKNTKNKTKNRK